MLEPGQSKNHLKLKVNGNKVAPLFPGSAPLTSKNFGQVGAVPYRYELTL